MNRDRNLLFGIFAVQLGKITPAQLVSAAGAWASDPSNELAQKLEEDGAISKAGKELLSNLVEEAVRGHGGDIAETLISFGGESKVHQTFRGSIHLTESGQVTVPGAPPEPVVLSDPDSVPGVHEQPGRYTNESEQGRGGMGRVLLVYDEHLGRDIALKELLPEMQGEGSGSGGATPVRRSMPIIARFLQEARITGQLEHPSIVPVYELGHRQNGSLYYTMKLVRGKTLT